VREMKAGKSVNPLFSDAGLPASSQSELAV
jgi:hypothetical protein